MPPADVPLLVDRDGPVATLTINRPDRLNAMDSIAHLALSEALDAVADDDTIRVVVLCGAGTRAFSVGRDLKEMAVADGNEAEGTVIAERWKRIKRLTDRLDYPKPIIAKVRGLALGGGFEIAMACDLIIASESASFGLPEPRRGLIPFAGGVHRLPRQVSLKVAMGHLLTGKPMSAARAYELGLVTEMTTDEALDDVVALWVADIIECAPLAIRAIKQCVSLGIDRPLWQAMADTYPAEEIRKLSKDTIEGPRAFSEKRAPIWNGQ